MTVDEQCEHATGEAGAIAVRPIPHICEALRCNTPSIEKSRYYYYNHGTLDYTSCGHKKANIYHILFNFHYIATYFVYYFTYSIFYIICNINASFNLSLILVVPKLCLCVQWKCPKSKCDCWWTMWTCNWGSRSHSIWSNTSHLRKTDVQHSFRPFCNLHRWNTWFYFMWT